VTPKALVTDTHPLLNFFGKRPDKLSKKVRKAFEAALSGDMVIYVPIYVLIEISQLMKKSKIWLPKPLEEWASDLFSSGHFVLTPLDAHIAFQYDRLAFTNDPADALIVATAVCLGLPLMTNDGNIHATKPCQLYWD